MPDPEQPAPAPTRSIPALRMLPSRPLRWLLQGCAWLCLALGIAGVFIPGLPTTVFILLAGWAAARSSERLHLWLWQHRLFGPMLQDWAAGGRVGRRAKWSASAAMALGAAVVCWAPVPSWVRWFSLTSMACVLAWLWARPET
ncbi:YbaN family protein [Comamonas endophytica]|uniref:YbaN family protein n=1 Tax=Comamonas endophytica TaxID=2949090 RepID=A0ABY6GB78_9BURK|nr:MULTISPECIES: YbaN family protein [unclassified Acidovorax]MCD2513886.1 YbaN family protein [Acidovorax sp. D4N7]UYG52118.1 YbaN family protein [Acidovorax sp. 5MLIR]